MEHWFLNSQLREVGERYWDGRDSHGDTVPSGIYFVVAFADNGNQTRTRKDCGCEEVI